MAGPDRADAVSCYGYRGGGGRAALRTLCPERARTYRGDGAGEVVDQ